MIVLLRLEGARTGRLAFGLLALLLLPGWGVRIMTVTPAKAVAASLGLLVAVRLGYDLVSNAGRNADPHGADGDVAGFPIPVARFPRHRSWHGGHQCGS